MTDRKSVLHRARTPSWTLALCLAATVSCTKKNPAYCESADDCTDPAAPFCDVDGAYGGNANSCIAEPNDLPDAGAISIDATPLPDAFVPVPDAAPAGVTALRQVSSAVGRLSGSTYQLDVQVGRPVGPAVTTGGDKSITPATPME